MKSLKIIFFGSPYYSVPLLDKTIELGHDVSLVVSQGLLKHVVEKSLRHLFINIVKKKILNVYFQLSSLIQ